MLAISCGHTQTISFCNQMEYIMDGKSTVPFFFGSYCSKSVKGHMIGNWFRKFEMSAGMSLFLHGWKVRLWFHARPSAVFLYIEKWFKDCILSFRKSPWGKGVGLDLTFLHVALIKPSVEGTTGLDSWPFPTLAQLVHLKRPWDRNSMPQEIECSCITVVCSSFMGLFFSSAFHTLSKERMWNTLSWSRAKVFCMSCISRGCFNASDCMASSAPPIWVLGGVFAECLRQPLPGILGVLQSQPGFFWKWMSGSQSISGAAVWSAQQRQLQCD